MNRIIVIGCPGSGKSTLSRELSQRTGTPLHHLDMMYWREDGTTVEKSLFLERLATAMAGNTWIIDGNYASTMDIRMAACDTVIFLDYPVEVCLEGIRSRVGKPRGDIPWTETRVDGELAKFVLDYPEQQRPRVLELIRKYGEGRRVVILQSRREAESFLENMITEESPHAY